MYANRDEEQTFGRVFYANTEMDVAGAGEHQCRHLPRAVDVQAPPATLGINGKMTHISDTGRAEVIPGWVGGCYRTSPPLNF